MNYHDVIQAASKRALTLDEIAVLLVAMDELRLRRLPMDRESKELNNSQKLCEATAIAHLRTDSRTVTVDGKKYSVGPQLDEPIASDWMALHAHIVETGEIDLLEKRLSASAVKARWQDGITVPGVEKYPVFKLQTEKV